MSHWPISISCKKIEIVEYQMSKKSGPTQARTIIEPKALKKIIDLLAQIPIEGDEFISWGPDTRILEMRFICESGPSLLRFFNGIIQTPPRSSFHSKPIKAQSELYEYLKSLLKNK